MVIYRFLKYRYVSRNEMYIFLKNSIYFGNYYSVYVVVEIEIFWRKCIICVKEVS